MYMSLIFLFSVLMSPLTYSRMPWIRFPKSKPFFKNNHKDCHLHDLSLIPSVVKFYICIKICLYINSKIYILCFLYIWWDFIHVYSRVCICFVYVCLIFLLTHILKQFFSFFFFFAVLVACGSFQARGPGSNLSHSSENAKSLTARLPWNSKIILIIVLS